MAKKFSKFLLFTTIAGAAAAGLYLYLKQKDDSAKDSDDFDDDISEFFDGDKKSGSDREYVSLDRSAVAGADAASDTDTADAPVEDTADKPEE